MIQDSLKDLARRKGGNVANMVTEVIRRLDDGECSIKAIASDQVLVTLKPCFDDPAGTPLTQFVMSTKTGNWRAVRQDPVVTKPKPVVAVVEVQMELAL